ncbi:hypothetical protein [Pseudemcibacter aquimaris]|uniref:hypothetical protein n=1 Tax=Pseudemcibacter aquimaris TaxID=2857064 RepID=UPI0020137F58|nr:hypothetical protein [Pseudemcibacter aquimaris]
MKFKAIVNSARRAPLLIKFKNKVRKKTVSSVTNNCDANSICTYGGPIVATTGVLRIWRQDLHSVEYGYDMSR